MADRRRGGRPPDSPGRLWQRASDRSRPRFRPGHDAGPVRHQRLERSDVAVNAVTTSTDMKESPMKRVSNVPPRHRSERSGPRPARHALATLILLAAALWTGAAWSQVDLTVFSAGDVIRADEVNANFRSLADLAEANDARLDAATAAETAGTVRVGPYDMVPSETFNTATAADEPYEFSRGPRGGKTGLELLPGASSSDGQFCFGTGLDLPDGATIVEFFAILGNEPGGFGTGQAEAFLQVRPWTDTRT